MSEENFDDIAQKYYYDDKPKKTTVRFFPEKNIATVTKTEFSGEEEIEVGTIVEGMTREELELYFPPMEAHRKQGHTYSLAKIIRSVIYEAFAKEGENIEEGNVRHFWYTHLKKLITEALGLGETKVVLTSINDAWGEMINSGLVTYEGLNILGGKENSRLSVVKDSPFSNIIVAVEKVDYFHMYKWIPRLFNSTLITAGGQPSRTVARAFIRELKKLGVDLSQDFFMCTISDLDPAGYYIQEAFRKQFESAIRYYGGNGRITIHRLFVREDQITPDLLRSQAMPCQDMAKTEKAKKAEDTKWEFFCKMTDGGIYMPKPVGWTDQVYEKDGEQVVRALLEMTAFSKDVIEHSILKELLKIIEETNDESKIMIPEIMRIFELMKGDVSEEKFAQWKRRLIQPLIDRFLRDTYAWEKHIYDKYYTDKKEIDNRYEEQITVKQDEAREQEPELYEQKDDLENKITELENQLSEVDDEIGEKCKDIFDEIDTLESEQEDEVSDIREEKDYKMEKLEEFKDEKSTVFNPLEQELKRNIELFIRNSPLLQFYFKDIEQLPRFQQHIGKLLTKPELLLEENTSCFEHPVFAFIEKDLLQKASAVKDENVGNVRNAFPKIFTSEMKNFIIEKIGDKVFEIDQDKIEFVDLSDDVRKAMEETDDKVEDGSWKDADTEED